MGADAANAVIDRLAEKVDVPSEKLMELLPHMGVIDVMFFGVGATLMLITLLGALRNVRNNVLCILYLITSLIAGGLAIATAPSAVLWLYSPEAWALNYMLSKF